MSKKKKRFRIFIDFDSEEDMQAWAQGTEKRPYEIRRADALDAIYSGPYRISKFVVTKFLDENAPSKVGLLSYGSLANQVCYSRFYTKVEPF